LVNKKYFSVKKNLACFLEKCFFFILNRKHFIEVVKNLKMSCYLLIISNLVLKFLIAIYFVCEKFRNVMLFVDYIKFGSQIFDCYIFCFEYFFFQFHPLKFDFYINFGPYFYDCYLLFSYHFFN
jgi:hypothetical protein